MSSSKIENEEFKSGVADGGGGVGDGLNQSLSKMSLATATTQKRKLNQQKLFGEAMTISTPSRWRDVSLIRQVPDHQECYQDCTFTDGSKFDLEVEGTGGCLVVEILGREDDVKNEDAALFFFRDLAEANGPGYAEGDVLFDRVWKVGRNSTKKDSESSSSNNCNTFSSSATTCTSPLVDGKGGACKHDSKKKREEHTNRNLMPNLSVRVDACSCIGSQSISPLNNCSELEKGKAERVRIELCVVRLPAVETDVLITLSMPMPRPTIMAEATSISSTGTCEDEKEKDHEDLIDGHSSLFLEILDGFDVLDWSLFG